MSNKQDADADARKSPELIFWVDSYGAGNLWQPTSDIVAKAHICRSVGWVVEENDDVLVVVPHISPEAEDIGAVECGCGEMAIPKSAILERISLSFPKGSRYLEQESNDG